MKLEDIGFYTLSDYRADHASISSPLYRCEMILTPMCNFKCPYCRGPHALAQKPMLFRDAKAILENWAVDGLKNVRFSGGEPTLWKDLHKLTGIARSLGVQRIAISTNGSAPFEIYERLHRHGVNDFSISLDACCSSTGSIMSGGKADFDIVCENIKRLSQITYVTVGVVITKENVEEISKIIEFADGLGVSDIRCIPAAQEDKLLPMPAKTEDILRRHPIFKYRHDNAVNGIKIRGLRETDSPTCWLTMDDMAVAGHYHWPCIIYMREGGAPIGKLSCETRNDRLNWAKKHNCHCDEICKKNCLDVCRDYNNRVNRQGKY